MLSHDQLKLYRDDGYVLVENLLDPQVQAALKNAVTEICDGARKLAESNEILDLEPNHTPQTPRVRRIKSPHAHFKLFGDLAAYPPLVEILKQLIGDNVRLRGSKINMKPANVGSPVEWHQDWAAYPHTNDDLLAVGVMIDDVNEENGPLLVVPGSHKAPNYNHHNEDGEFVCAIDPAQNPTLDLSRAVPLTGKAGSMSFHHVRTVHGSAQNTSSRPRTLLLFEYAAADAFPLSGVQNWQEYNSRIVAGAPTLDIRIGSVPARAPYPPANGAGNIYENQAGAKKRYFVVK